MPVITIPHHQRHEADYLRRSSVQQLHQISSNTIVTRRNRQRYHTLTRSHDSGIDSQTQSCLLSLPQELQDLIWTMYYADHNEMTTHQDGKFSVVVQGGDPLGVHRNLRLTCRKINLDTQPIRAAAPWTLNLACMDKGLVNFDPVLQHSQLSNILGKITRLVVRGLVCDDIQWRTEFTSEWATLSRILPALKCIAVTYTRRVETGDPDEYNSQADWSHEDGQKFRAEMKRGVYDDRYSWPVDRLALDRLAKQLFKNGKDKVQVYLLSRCDFQDKGRSWWMDTMTFRILHDQVKTVARNEFPIDEKTGWAMVSDEDF